MIGNIHAARSKMMLASLTIFALSGCDKIPFGDKSHGAIAACEEKLKNTLVSPASYKRLKSSYNAMDFTFDDYYQSRGGDECGLTIKDGCELSEQLARRLGAKDWLISKKELMAGADFGEVMSRNTNKPFPNVSFRKTMEADREFIRYTYNKRFGPTATNKFPAAVVGIEYDAVNQYNAPLRSEFACRFTPTDRDEYIRSDMF